MRPPGYLEIRTVNEETAATNGEVLSTPNQVWLRCQGAPKQSSYAHSESIKLDSESACNYFPFELGAKFL